MTIEHAWVITMSVPIQSDNLTRLGKIQMRRTHGHENEKVYCKQKLYYNYIVVQFIHKHLESFIHIHTTHNLFPLKIFYSIYNGFHTFNFFSCIEYFKSRLDRTPIIFVSLFDSFELKKKKFSRF